MNCFLIIRRLTKFNNNESMNIFLMINLFHLFFKVKLPILNYFIFF